MTKTVGDRICVAVLAALAVALHVQPILPFGGSEVRVSLSDLVALVLVPFAVYAAYRARFFILYQRELLIGLALFAVATIVMTMGLLRADAGGTGITSWAKVKYAGWFVLMYYGVLGALAGGVTGRVCVCWFLRIFILLHAVVIVLFLVTKSLNLSVLGTEGQRLAGFLFNPNAYGMSLLCALAIMFGVGGQLFRHISAASLGALCGLLAAGILFTRSIGALVGFVAICLVVFVVRRKMMPMVRIVVLSLVFYSIPPVLSYFGDMLGMTAGKLESSIMNKLADPDFHGQTLSARLQSNRRALSMWSDEPLLGAGLGVFYAKEKAAIAGQKKKKALQIHNTVLWILAELGLVGFVAFGALFSTAALFLVRQRQVFHSLDPPLSDFAFTGLLILCAWSVMSLVHEVMYQRVPWIMTGLIVGILLSTTSARGPAEAS